MHDLEVVLVKEVTKKDGGGTAKNMIDEDIAVAPKPPSRLFGNHFIKITDTRLIDEFYLKQKQ